VQEAILDCSLFVTDWSSTFFDAAYAGRPLVMVPFDEVEFRRTQYAKGYFDFDRDGFGPVARSVEDALTAIAHYVRTDFEREQRFEERVRSFFVHRDTRNCERVVEGIARALSGQPASVVPVAPEPSAESVPMPLVS
jgi:CDP-glycerol glycerophosphotransferase (TagB/SpsB family)